MHWYNYVLVIWRFFVKNTIFLVWFIFDSYAIYTTHKQRTDCTANLTWNCWNDSLTFWHKTAWVKLEFQWTFANNLICCAFFRAKMRTINSHQTVKIPRGIEAFVKSRIVTIKGPRGVLKRNFKHLSLDIQMISPRTLKVEKWFGTKKELAAVRTVCSHILNMIKGELVSKYRWDGHCIGRNVLCCWC